MQLTKNFKSSEFDSPDLPHSGKKMRIEFISQLQYARDIAEIPFKINSGFRTKEHNQKVGGTINSSDLYGYACDIHCNSDLDRFTIVNALLMAGFTRIGIAKTFIHVDSDPKKNSFRIWMY